MTEQTNWQIKRIANKLKISYIYKNVDPLKAEKESLKLKKSWNIKICAPNQEEKESFELNQVKICGPTQEEKESFKLKQVNYQKYVDPLKKRRSPTRQRTRNVVEKRLLSPITLSSPFPNEKVPTSDPMKAHDSASSTSQEIPPSSPGTNMRTLSRTGASNNFIVKNETLTPIFSLNYTVHLIFVSSTTIASWSKTLS